MDQIWLKFKKYEKDLDVGTSETKTVHNQNIEVVYDNVDDDDDDYVLTPREFSKQSEDFELPNHDRCATYTL